MLPMLLLLLLLLALPARENTETTRLYGWRAHRRRPHPPPRRSSGGVRVPWLSGSTLQMAMAVAAAVVTAAA
jgi:hypothetical protein